jgi:aminopeptidase-like protein
VLRPDPARPDPIRPGDAGAGVRAGGSGHGTARCCGARTLDDDANVGARIYDLAAELYPVCRSITGDGVRLTLGLLARHIDIDVTEVPSGTQVFDWTIPREWSIADAYIADAAGRRVVDFRASNLHVLNYSAPVRTVLPLEQLKEHIFSLPDQPDLVPYRTSYYAERWGFCMSQRALDALPPGDYTAVIDSTLAEGSLTYGEHVVPGDGEDEVLLSAHICHPSLANDNCSGLALLTILARELGRRPTRLTYRFVFAPGTIGAITWLARNEAHASRIKHGLTVSCVGDAGGPTYKRSRRGDAPIDRVMTHVLKHAAPSAVIEDFSPYGYDERQYCSPGFNLPVGSFQRSKYGTFPEYHTSADNLDFIAPEHLEHSYRLILAAIDILEKDRVLVNTAPKCEPALGRRGLYATVGGDKAAAQDNMAMLWVLNFSDGTHSLLDIAERSAMPFAVIEAVAVRLEEAELLAAP